MSFQLIPAECPRPPGEVMSALLPEILKQMIKENSGIYGMLITAAVLDRNVALLTWLLANRPEFDAKLYSLPVSLALITGNQEMIQKFIDANIPLNVASVSAEDIKDAKEALIPSSSPESKQLEAEMPGAVLLGRKSASIISTVPIPEGGAWQADELAKLPGNIQFSTWIARGAQQPYSQVQPGYGIGALLGGSPQLYAGLTQSPVRRQQETKIPQGLMNFLALVKGVATQIPDDAQLGARIIEDEKLFPTEMIQQTTPAIANSIKLLRDRIGSINEVAEEVKSQQEQLDPNVRRVSKDFVFAALSQAIKNQGAVPYRIVSTFFPGQEREFIEQTDAYERSARQIGQLLRENAQLI